jgi:hypothetical protein
LLEPSEPSPLEVEWKAFQERRDMLVAASYGKYVLIQGTEVLGIFDSESEGVVAGYRLRGMDRAFLVHRIVPEEEEVVGFLGFFSLSP